MVADDETIDWRGFRAYPWNLPQPIKGAYRLTNLVNGKPYVGVGGLAPKTNVLTRSIAHSRTGSPPRLKRALAKYGKSSFLIEPILYLTSSISKEEFLQIEADLVKRTKSSEYGYNIIEMSESGNYGPGHGAAVSAALSTPEMKAHLSQKSKIALNHPETKALISANSKAIWQDPKVRDKIVKSMKANWEDPEKKSSYLAAMAAGRDYPDYKENLSKASKAHRNDPDTKAAYSALMKSLVWITDGTKNQRVPPSAPLPEGWRLGRAPGLYTPERLERWKNRMAQVRNDPGHKARLSAGQAAAWATDEDRRQRASSNMKSIRSSEGAVAQYESVKGSVWITDGTKCQRIRPEDSIPDGWYRGKLSSKGKTKA